MSFTSSSLRRRAALIARDAKMLAEIGFKPE